MFIHLDLTDSIAQAVRLLLVFRLLLANHFQGDQGDTASKPLQITPLHHLRQPLLHLLRDPSDSIVIASPRADFAREIRPVEDRAAGLGPEGFIVSA